MANEEQLAILKQGVDFWNKWREDNPDVRIDFNGADLKITGLSAVNLRGADLRGANLFAAILRGADLRGTHLSEANLTGADLSNANLMGAHLALADLNGINLIEANLRGADLSNASLFRGYLRGSNFYGIKLSGTILGSLDLRQVAELDEVIHRGPSTIGTDTFAKSAGQIPEVFLRGCGLSDWEIEETKLYNPDLGNEEINKILYRIYDLRATQALQILPLFISYSHADSKFVDKIGERLNKKGIRYWRDLHEMKAGRIETQIDRAIHQNPTVLMILSEHSLSSDWVEYEVRTGRELEKELSRDVLCPVALDDSWKSSHWPKRLMEQIMEYNILDFSEWENDRKFEGMFHRLIDGLDLFYK